MAFLKGRVVDATGKGEGKREGQEGKGMTPQCLKCVDAHGLLTETRPRLADIWDVTK